MAGCRGAEMYKFGRPGQEPSQAAKAATSNRRGWHTHSHCVTSPNRQDLWVTGALPKSEGHIQTPKAVLVIQGQARQMTDSECVVVHGHMCECPGCRARL